MTTRYLAVRTDREKQTFIMDELKKGRLRQGWGWDSCQDLRLLIKKRDSGKRLNDEESSAWRNRRLLHTEPDGVKPGDVLVLPNLPENGYWVIARVTGGYSFSISQVKSVAGPDYGHIVEIGAVKDPSGEIAVFDPHNKNVDARLRAQMRNQGRMWGIDTLGDAIDRLIKAVETGEDTKLAQPESKKMEGFFTSIREAAWRAIVERYKAAEFEKLVHELLRRIYTNGKVEHWGGTGEHGADLIVFTRDPLGLEYKVAVQVKLHEGVHDDKKALDQIKEAKKVHRVDAGVIVTMATSTSASFNQHRDVLEEDLGIDIRVIARDEFVELVMANMGTQTL